jgi:hypothetical protein
MSNYTVKQLARLSLAVGLLALAAGLIAIVP